MRRKTLLFIVVVSALCCNHLHAQTEFGWNHDRPYRVSLGPKASIGLAIGSDSKTYHLDLTGGLAYQFGAAINARFGRLNQASEGGTGLLGAQVEALYSVRNVNIEGDRLKMSCIELPLLVQVYPNPNFAIEAGFTLLKTISSSPDKMTFDNVAISTGEIKGGDVMLTLGVCLRSSGGLMADVRYNMGNSQLASNFDTKVSSVVLSLTYLINFIK